MTTNTFKRWYESHKEDFNEFRRSRYHTDPEYRERVINYAKVSRERAKVRPKPPKKFWSISETAASAETSVAALRYWEGKKVIPRPDTGTVRRYTMHQVALIKFFFSEMKRLQSLVESKELTKTRYDSELDSVSNTIRKEWDSGSQDY
jgi:hypothetical protein